jgi:Domain of unknown function (DUF4956)
MLQPAASPPAPRDGMPRPRLGWLLLFQALIITLVVLIARESRALTGPPMLEQQLDTLAEGSNADGISPWGGRGWLVALVAMLGALLLMLPVAWAYVATRLQKKVDSSVVTTIVVLPIAVAAILVIVQDSLAVAFSLAGIAGLVRFRNALDDTRDAMYVVIAIAVGLGAGVGTLEASAALTGLYVVSVVALWKWHTSDPVIADIALGEMKVPDGQTVLQALSGNRQPPRAVAAEWYEAEQAVALDGNGSGKRAPDKRDGLLRLQAADDAPTRRSIEEVLESHTKRWALQGNGTNQDGKSELTYAVRLKKRIPSDAVLEALRQRMGEQVGEYTPMKPAHHGSSPDDGS